MGTKVDLLLRYKGNVEREGAAFNFPDVSA